MTNKLVDVDLDLGKEKWTALWTAMSREVSVRGGGWEFLGLWGIKITYLARDEATGGEEIEEGSRTHLSPTTQNVIAHGAIRMTHGFRWIFIQARTPCHGPSHDFPHP